MRLGARYLLAEGAARAAPPIRWRISTSPTERVSNASAWAPTRPTRATKESATLMVNYLYDPDRIEAWHEDYAGEGRRNASTMVRRLARGWG